MKNKNLWLVVIIVIAIILRLWKLGSAPINLTPDEASLGYNAYSILHTARDEYGKILPIVFKSFGDYKPGLYVYLVVPFVSILGLNEWSVRLPSALAGVGAVVLVYLLIKGLGKESEDKYGWLALSTAFVLAVSPWHIAFSRGGWEANVALTMVLAGIYFFIENFKFKLSTDKFILMESWRLILSGTFFGLSLWMYQGAKLSTLLVLLALVVVYGKVWIKKMNFAKFAILILVIGIWSSPIIWGLVRGETGGRLKVKSLFSYHRPDSVIENQILKPGGITRDSWEFVLWQDEWLSNLENILNRYGNYFSGRFLVIEGDWEHPQLTASYMGVMYFSDVIMLYLGLSWLYLKAKQKKLDEDVIRLSVFMFLWMCLAPLAGALSLDDVNSVRTLQMLLPFVYFVAFGWKVCFDFFSRRRSGLKMLGLIVAISLFMYQIFYYLDSYYVMSPKLTAQLGQGYGYKQIVQALNSYRNSSNKIVVYQSYDQPYIYWLFYEKFDPNKYQQVAHLDENKYGDVGLVGNIDDQIEFREFSLNAEKHLSGNIYVGPPDKMVLDSESDWDKVNVLKDIKYPNGNLAFRIVEIK